MLPQPMCQEMSMSWPMEVVEIMGISKHLPSIIMEVLA